MKNPLAGPLVALAAGIVAARYIGLQRGDLWIALPLCFLLWLAWRVHAPRLVAALVSLLMAIAGAAVQILHRPGPPPQLDAGPRENVLVSGCVVEPSAFYEGRDQFTIELAPGARARVTLAVKEGETPPELRYGQIVEFDAKFRAIRNFQNPGAFDYAEFAARQQIFWTASAAPGGTVTPQPGRCGSRFLEAVFALRSAALRRIERLYPNNPYATGMLEATLIGETRKLEKIWTEHFRATGTYHLLVISGVHITVLACALLFLLRLCLLPEIPALAAAAAGAWLYALVAGANAPVIRAAGGFTFYLVARFVYRRARLLNLLAAVAIVYLIYDPGQLFDAGFQLSFLCVAAIGALGVPLLDATSAPLARGLAGIGESSRDPRLPPRAAQFRLELRLLAETLHCWLRVPQTWFERFLALCARVVLFAWELAVVSALIQIALALPMALYFHRIPLTAVSANLPAAPLLSLVVPVGFLAIFTGWHFPAAVAEWMLRSAERVADWHMRWEPDWRVADPPFWLCIAFAAALLALAYFGTRSRRNCAILSLPVAVCFVLVFWHPFPPHTRAGELELTAIDVGQGDSLLLSFPDGKLMLVDGGGVLSFGRPGRPKMDIGEDVVSPYLWARSIRRIDVMVLTHAHDDHAGGLPALIGNFHPAELWTGATPVSPAWSAVRDRAQARHVRILGRQAGERFDFGGAGIEILSPPAAYQPDQEPKNNDSLAMRITYGRRSFLLTGDLERSMEVQLLADGRLLRADVLKVGHHGSNTSSIQPFLDAASPTLALISAGFENSFRHPHPRVLDRLSAHRSGILRTDLQGLLTIHTDGRRMEVETFLPRIETVPSIPQMKSAPVSSSTRQTRQ